MRFIYTRRKKIYSKQYLWASKKAAHSRMTLNKKSLGILKQQPVTNECCSELYTAI